MLNGKVALVTGASSGIGKAVALKLAQEGASVAVLASSQRIKAQAVVDEIVAAGGSAAAYAADVSDGDAIRQVVSDITADLGTISVLVTAAGIFLPTPAIDGDAVVFDRTMDINVKGVFRAITAVLPGMKALGEGRIVCLSSVGAQMAVTGFSGYCASKAAVSMLVRSMALELAPLNININAIAPGNTATPMNEGMRLDPAQAGFLQAIEAATPSTRTFSEPSDIAELACFLAGSAAARAMHGSTLLIDEGISAGL